MALSRTDHTAHLSTTSGTSTTTGSYTFAAGRAVVVVVKAILDSTGETPFSSLISLGDTGAGLTWVPFLNVDYADGDEFGPGMRAFWAIGNGTPCTLTASKTGQNVGRWYIRPLSWSGADTSSPIGATMTHVPGTTGGAVSANLSAAPSASSDVVSCALGTLNGNAASAITQGADQTEIWDQQSDDWFESQGQARTGSTSQSIAWADVNPNSVSYYKAPIYFAFEVKEAASGVTGTLSKTLAAATALSNGTVLVSGTATPTLGALTSTGQVAVDVSGSTAKTLGALTVAAVGSVGDSTEGTVNKTLADCACVSAGTVRVDGVTNATLGNVTSVGAGTVNISGSLAKTLGQLVLSATGDNGMPSIPTGGRLPRRRGR